MIQLRNYGALRWLAVSCLSGILITSFSSCESDKGNVPPETDALEIVYVFVGVTDLLSPNSGDVDELGEPIKIKFSLSVDPGSAEEAITLSRGGQNVDVSFGFNDDNQLLMLSPVELEESSTYTISITSELKGMNGEKFKGIQVSFNTYTIPLAIEQITIDDEPVNSVARIRDISRQPDLKFIFNLPVTVEEISGHVSLELAGMEQPISLTQLDERTILAEPQDELEGYGKYNFTIATSLANDIDRPFDGFELEFYTELDSTYKFPEITDDELLTKIQKQTFKYFWDFGHPVSGLARERNSSGETVTIGGSGFGVMAILVAIERGFITRQEGMDRFETIVNFLKEADRFHGVWPHWMNGTTGKVIPFSADDDGGDLVETAFMVQGLLTVREYLNDTDVQEAEIKATITQLWEEVEWDWYTQGGQNVLYWHWSPNFNWQKNQKIQGWNEALIIYVLAAASPTHGIDADVYTKGWARNGDMVNGGEFYGYNLPLGEDRGGSLFFSHYSFLGLDPRNLNDQYADYWEQNINHTLINRAYCMSNPSNYVGYGETAWGLTASDNHEGYSAHSPNNDKGVITPTAAISSIPYASTESLAAIHHFYYLMGDKLWGEYGFYDAYNVTEGWYANSYLAIDQGPIIVMIENYRTALLWNLFMQSSEVQSGLDKLNFNY